MSLVEIKMLIGQRIACARQSQGLSQRKFSLMIGLDRTTLNRIESGAGNPTIETLHRIAKGLEIDITQLFYNPGGKETCPSNVFNRISFGGETASSPSKKTHPLVKQTYTQSKRGQLR